jgi:ATP-dependent exoDNAse (exonuclease V) alpha subunit
MAIYHCSIKNISRGSGKSAVASASYRAGEKLEDLETGLIHDYTRKKEIAYSEIFLCKNAPKEYQDRGTLWNAVEQIEKQSKARLAREWEVALPNELTLEQSKELVKGFAQSLVDEGMCVDVNIHWKEGNHHAHIMATVRAINEKGQWAPKTKKVYCRDVYGQKIPLIDKNTGLQKVDKQNRKQWKCYKDDYTDWNKREKVEEWRSRWAEHCNMALEKAQSIARVDHRSYAAQGKEILPTIHEGYIARKIEANGGISERCEINREIRGKNYLIQKFIYEIQLLTKQITDLTKQKGEEINERFANLFNRQRRSRENVNSERGNSSGKRGIERTDIQSFIANLDSERGTAEFDRQRSETERKNRDDERKRQDRARKREIEREERESKAREKASRTRSRDEGPEL